MIRPAVATPERLLPWLERLVGLDEARASDAVGQLRSWKLDHLERGLLERPDLDTLAAAVLLAESVTALVDQGVQHTKLISKLRSARSSEQFWPVWAEIRTAAILIGREDYGARIELEPDAAKGRHADFRVTHGDGSSVDIEFKAVGLSDVEADWYRRASEHFNRLLPPGGLATCHGWLDKPVFVRRDKRERSFRQARELSQGFREEFPAWADVRGISIVAHEHEQTYLKRAAGRLSDALGQMSSAEENWLGLWWGNGAVTSDTSKVLAMAGAPATIAGVVSIGQGIAVPWSQINVFVVSAPAEAIEGRHTDSAVDDHLANLILDRFDSSSGLRAIMLRAPGRESTILLKRDGRRRLFPFNLLFDADPRSLAAPTRPPSPVQDVQLLD